MLEHAFKGSRNYWLLLCFWGIIIAMGAGAYAVQLRDGLTITGMSRDVSWGFYIAQFTFMVGVAASAVMVVLPYYLHDYKAFQKMVILGEFVAVPAVLCCMLFIFVDMGQPMRVMNVILHPTPNSVMFWDMSVLMGYLLLNLVIGTITLDSERKGKHYPKWLKFFIYLSIPWAASIHTVTAFLYAGLEGRPFWLTAILAPRFLASAFATGPSLLILLALIVRKVSKFDPGDKAIKALANVVTYAMLINLFFFLVEAFTGIYSDMPHHLHAFEYMFLGLEHHGETYNKLVPWMRTGMALSFITGILLVFPGIRWNLKVLPVVCVFLICGTWIEKGLGLVITGFIPSPTGHITEYWPTAPEMMITLGVYGVGALVLTILYKIIIGVRERRAGHSSDI